MCRVTLHMTRESESNQHLIPGKESRTAGVDGWYGEVPLTRQLQSPRAAFIGRSSLQLHTASTNNNVSFHPICLALPCLALRWVQGLPHCKRANAFCKTQPHRFSNFLILSPTTLLPSPSARSAFHIIQQYPHAERLAQNLGR